MPEAYTYLSLHKYLGAPIDLEITTADPQVLSQFLSAVLKDSVTLDINGSDGHIHTPVYSAVGGGHGWLFFCSFLYSFGGCC